jgi:hypothetical protein
LRLLKERIAVGESREMGLRSRVDQLTMEVERAEAGVCEPRQDGGLMMGVSGVNAVRALRLALEAERAQRLAVEAEVGSLHAWIKALEETRERLSASECEVGSLRGEVRVLRDELAKAHLMMESERFDRSLLEGRLARSGEQALHRDLADAREQLVRALREIQLLKVEVAEVRGTVSEGAGQVHVRVGGSLARQALAGEVLRPAEQVAAEVRGADLVEMAAVTWEMCRPRAIAERSEQYWEAVQELADLTRIRLVSRADGRGRVMAAMDVAVEQWTGRRRALRTADLEALRDEARCIVGFLGYRLGGREVGSEVRSPPEIRPSEGARCSDGG